MFRKFLAFFLVLLWMPACSALAETVASVCNPNPADRLNLRAAPDEQAASLGKYYNGVVVTVLAEENGWAEVVVGDGDGAARGWMMTDYLRMGMGEGTVASAMPVFAADQVTLYAGTDGNTPLATFSQATVEVVGEAGSWRHVRVNGVYGYVPAASGAAPSPGIGMQTAVVNNPDPADRLNLRAAPDTDAVSLGKYYNGVSVDVLECLEDGWLRVRVAGVDGYMLSKYLAFGDAAAAVVSACPAYWVSNPDPADRLNLRETPSRDARSLGRYGNGTQVTVLGIAGDAWFHVQVEGQTGFMMAQYLSASREQALAQPSPQARITLAAALVELPIHRDADAASGVLTTLDAGQSVYVLTRGEVWTYVSTGSSTGYALTEGLDFSE